MCDNCFFLKIQRPDRTRFIRLYLERTNELVHSIDVTSSDVTFPEQCEDCEGRTLTFSINYNGFIPGESYYILIDGGTCIQGRSGVLQQ